MSTRMVVIPVMAVALMAIVGGRPPAAPASPAAPSSPVAPAAAVHLAWPLTRWVETQPFGCTSFVLEPFAAWCPSRHFHSGIDMAAPAGTPIHAAAAGVATVYWNPGGYGLYVVIDHGGGTGTLYGHMEWTPLRSGEHVQADEVIGHVGSTGLSTGPHVHFEVRRNGHPVDPAPLLPARSAR